MLVVDKWARGPIDVAHDNAENSLVKVFSDHVDKDPALKEKVAAQTEAYLKIKNDRPKPTEETKAAHTKLVLGGIAGGLKGLKKTEVKEKTMFNKLEGQVREGGAHADAKSMGKVLSKMIDFPGDKEAIAGHLANAEVSAGGADAFGLTALMKFASWNKTEFIDMIMPKLTKEEVNKQDPEGKTALHWAVEMASVAAVSKLVTFDAVDKEVKDKKGRTPRDILKAGEGSVIGRLEQALNGEE